MAERRIIVQHSVVDYSTERLIADANEELRKRLDIEDVADVVRKSRLGWFGHLERKEGGDWVHCSACKTMVVP